MEERSKKSTTRKWMEREGKFRQVRKMTSVVGFPTLRLVRVRIGNMTLGQMVSGDVKEVAMFDLPI